MPQMQSIKQRVTVTIIASDNHDDNDDFWFIGCLVTDWATQKESASDSRGH